METKVLILFVICITFVQSEYVYKKFCKDVNTSVCTINKVEIDKCETVKYCRMKRNRKYPISVALTPHFSAESIKLSTFSDETGTDEFSHELVTSDLADGTTMTKDSLQNITYSFSPPKDFPQGKYAVKMKFYNNEDDTQVCCFVFNIKIK